MFVTRNYLSAGPSKVQSFPPLDAGELVQVLVSVFTPPPHFTLHFDSDQSVYPPSTALMKKNDPNRMDFLLNIDQNFRHLVDDGDQWNLLLVAFKRLSTLLIEEKKSGVGASQTNLQFR